MIIIINFYNPCKKLEISKVEEMGMKGNIIWCGDFNVHHSLWGSDGTDYNGMVLKEFFHDNILVCLNDGRKTRIDVRSGKESVLDLTFASSSLAPLCEWQVKNKSFGCDHFMVVSRIRIGQVPVPETVGEKWRFGKARWGDFSRLCERKLLQVQNRLSVERMSQEIS